MEAGRPRPQLDSRADVVTEAARMRAARRHIAPVRWQGQSAWLKLAVAQPPAWRYQLLGGAARLLGQPALQPVRPHGGHRGLRVEVARMRALAAAGLRAPTPLEMADDWLLLSDLGQVTLESLIRHAAPEARLAHWRRGADYILGVHRAGQYLSQAFARNFVWSDGGGLGAIDFEDDALTAMSISDAQVRDWLPYCFSTAIYFGDRLPQLLGAMGDVLAGERAAVRAGVLGALRRTAWLRALRRLPACMQRHDVRKTRWFAELAHLCGRSHGMAPRPR